MRQRKFKVSDFIECTTLRVSPSCLEYALLAEPKPARDPTLRLRRLPLHSLIKIVDRLIELLLRIILALVELGGGVVLELLKLGLGLAHFGRNGFVGLVNLGADIIDLCAGHSLARSNGIRAKRKNHQAYRVINLRACNLCPFFTLLLRFCAGDVLAPHRGFGFFDIIYQSVLA